MNFGHVRVGRGPTTTRSILRGQQPAFYGQVSWALSSPPCRKWHPRSAGLTVIWYAAVGKDYRNEWINLLICIQFYRDYNRDIPHELQQILVWDVFSGSWNLNESVFVSWFMSAKGCVAVAPLFFWVKAWCPSSQNGQPPNGISPPAEAPSPLHGKLSKDVFTDAPCMEYSPFFW